MRYQMLSLIDILKPADGSDCTNYGLSSRFTEATLLIPESIKGPELLGGLQDIDTETLTEPVFILIKRDIYGSPYYHAEPFRNACHKHYMFGGNFLYYCGNGFRSICEYPVPIHDRAEW